MILDNSQKKWQDVVEDNHEGKGKVHVMRWEVYIKYMENMINSVFGGG